MSQMNIRERLEVEKKKMILSLFPDILWIASVCPGKYK